MYDVNDVRHWGIDPAIAGSELDFGWEAMVFDQSLKSFKIHGIGVVEKCTTE